VVVERGGTTFATEEEEVVVVDGEGEDEEAEEGREEEKEDDKAEAFEATVTAADMGGRVAQGEKKEGTNASVSRRTRNRNSTGRRVRNEEG